ncbi:MAG: cold shock domain-containing protein [Alphaproteobacteria bacterium]|nr:cold shock domain-containing protein [Alphaproteobacteria bacterium]
MRGSALSSFDTTPATDQGFQTEAVVKWFNLTKGFGFVAPVDGSSDAFIHSSVVSRAGLRDVVEGTKLLVQIGDGAKGRQVISIVEVLGMGEVPQATARPAPTGPEVEMSGTVKWFKPDKGFGFVTPDDGGRDVFVHRTVVLRAGAQTLESGQKVKMMVQTAAKGREASSIELMD